MLDLDVFSYRATDNTLCTSFERILQILRPYIDTNGWDPQVHDKMLRSRLRSKMAIIRKQLLSEHVIQRRGTSYIRALHPPPAAATTPLTPPGNGQSNATDADGIKAALGDIRSRVEQVREELERLTQALDRVCVDTLSITT